VDEEEGEAGSWEEESLLGALLRVAVGSRVKEEEEREGEAVVVGSTDGEVVELVADEGSCTNMELELLELEDELKVTVIFTTGAKEGILS